MAADTMTEVGQAQGGVGGGGNNAVTWTLEEGLPPCANSGAESSSTWPWRLGRSTRTSLGGS